MPWCPKLLALLELLPVAHVLARVVRMCCTSLLLSDPRPSHAPCPSAELGTVCSHFQSESVVCHGSCPQHLRLCSGHNCFSLVPLGRSLASGMGAP